MTHNIPFEIQVEIIKCLPVKSLMQFRSVSKPWKSLIDSCQFSAGYSGRTQRLLVRYYPGSEYKYVSVVDDETISQQRVTLTLPVLVNMLDRCRVVGSSNGLLCLEGLYCKKSHVNFRPLIGIAVLWNVSIRKGLVVVVPDLEIDRYNERYTTFLGFGGCRETNDPKIVKIRCFSWSSDVKRTSRIRSQVEVFTLSTRAWRKPYSSNLPRKSIIIEREQAIVDGFLYWFATDTSRLCSRLLIMSFDIASEEFREVNLPYGIPARSFCDMSMSNLRESLVVLYHDRRNSSYVVWMMEDGVLKSFTKLLTFNVDALVASIAGFRKSGELVVGIIEDGHEQLAIYEPHSKHIDKLGIDGSAYLNCVYPYMETMLLYDQSNLTFYNVMETVKFLESLVS